MGTAFDMTIEENLAIATPGANPGDFTPRHIGKQIWLFSWKAGSSLELGLENGMKEKVGDSRRPAASLTLLMATIVKPKLLLLDEHTAALDPSIARRVLELTDGK